jgi:hypothetical protein
MELLRTLSLIAAGAVGAALLKRALGGMSPNPLPRKLRQQLKAFDALEAARAEGPDAVGRLAFGALHGGPFPEGIGGRGAMRAVLTGEHLADMSVRAPLLPKEREALARVKATYEREEEARRPEMERMVAVEAEAMAARQSAQEAAWGAYLKELGLANDEVALAVASVLDDPRKAHPAWFREAVEALKVNRATGGGVWRAYEKWGELSPGAIKAAIRAYRRHGRTSYDEMLRRGMSREVARLVAEEEEGG